MTDQQILRIGRGPQAPKQTPKTWPWVLAAAVLISVSALILVALFFDPPQPEAQPPQKPAALVVQCENIGHEYQSWLDGKSRLTELPTRSLFISDLESEDLAEDGEALYKAVTNYKDRPSIVFTRAIADYNYQLGLLRLSIMGAGEFDSVQYGVVVESWSGVQAAYAAFATDTCR